MLFESWWRGLSGRRTARPRLCPSGLSGSRARLSAARVGGGGVRLEFVSPLLPTRLRVVLALPARHGRPSVGRFVTARPGRARDGLAWPACRVHQAQSCLSGVSRAGRQYRWRLLAASRASRASRQYPGLRSAPEVSATGRQYPQRPIGL